ncbi:hypothetical protein K440DRAFT_618525 [Wilcoxina mikolae CBS 423.85]|nr:hypothetical protein K440DRAFT_618525 [Wilcoxina mikolae CBS 423.85]
MDETRAEGFTSDGRNPSYDETGLQTSNNFQEQQPPEPQQTDQAPKNYKSQEVIDPVTHLPITTHDITDEELERIPPPLESPQPQPEDEILRKDDSDKRHDAMIELVQDETKGRWVDYAEMERRGRVRAAFVAGATAALGTLLVFMWAVAVAGRDGVGFGWVETGVGVIGCGVLGVGTAAAAWVFTGVEDDSDGQGVVEQKKQVSPAQHKPPEPAAWLNSLLSSLWPIVNPSLFSSLADMLEDVMQASLPKLVRGVRVADLGQGNESMRILGIRWLEAGDAGEDKHGMQGEEGDFANFEVAVAYRARPTTATGGGLRKRSRNAHLLIEFRTVGGIEIPVWVEVTGFLATARVRVQLTPNPPFLGLATLTLLGQPKVNVSCVPLAKNFLNVMDLPVANRYLQKSIDEAVGMYVAPRSLTLDLKTLLTGREKMDTESVGVIVIRVISAIGFKDGDGGKKWLNEKKKRGDPYVIVGWGKYGKGMWTTRVIESEGEPVWDETNAVLVGPLEVNADENLRLQLWDSDRGTADDLLGAVEVPLKDVMSYHATKNRMSAREDPLCDFEGKPCPGFLHWDVGYFSKLSLDDHLSKLSNVDVEEMKRKIEIDAEKKLREAKGTDESGEIDQQKREDLKERSDEIIAGSPPNDDWPSGILSIKIEQITGLEVEHIRESGVREGSEDEEGGDLPSAYCTVILNHQKVYKTRTKLKDNKPFFDAGTERFLRDFRTTSVIISVRDHRPHESDPLLGIVVVPLPKIFSSRSQLTSSFPLTGGIGYGRLRLSLSFRSVQLRLPPQLLGWNIGTLEIFPHATASENLPDGLKTNRLVFRTLYGKRKLFPDSSSPGTWNRKRRERPIRLAVCKRYASCLLVQFRQYSIGPDTTSAFCTLWFKDPCDNEEVELELPVRRKIGDAMHRAVRNAVDEGEVVGSLKLRLRYYPGLSGYHQSLASSDKDIADVMEVLDAAEDAKEVESIPSVDSSSSSSSSSDDDDDSVNEDSKYDDGKRGFKDELKEYKQNRKDLHRRHRGLMQWQAARKLAWVGREMKERGHELSTDVKGKLKHRSGRGDGDKVEMEV